MSNIKRKFEENMDNLSELNEINTPKCKIEKKIDDNITPRSCEIFKIIQEVENDISKYEIMNEEVKRLNIIIEKKNEENKKLNDQLKNFENELIDKNNKIKEYEMKLKIYDTDKSIYPIKNNRNESIACLKNAIQKYKDENRLYKTLNTDFLLLKNKYNEYENIVKDKDRQLDIYKKWIEQDRDESCNKMKEMEKYSNDLQIKYNKIKNKNEILKINYNNLKLNIKNIDECNIKLKNEIELIREECLNYKKELIESNAGKNRIINCRDTYKQIIDSYNELITPVEETCTEKCLRERINKMEYLILSLEQECIKLEVSNSILSFESQKNNISSLDMSENNKSSFTNNIENNNERVLHLKNNPYEIYQKTITQKYEDLLKQNNTLNEIIKQLTEQFSSKGENKNSIECKELINLLKSMPSASLFNEIKEEAEKNKTLAVRFKQVCAEKINTIRSDIVHLLGYGFEYDSSNTIIKLIPLYSKTPDEYIEFKRIGNGKNMELLQNNFTKSISNMITQYKEHPLLNSSVCLYLYEQLN